MKKNPNNDPSVEFEPHLRNSQFEIDPSEANAKKILSQNKITEYDLIVNSIWDEPAIESLQGCQNARQHYAGWLQERITATSHLKSWLNTLLLICISGLWAVVGVFMLFLQGKGVGELVATVILAPIIEEVLKISAPLLVVEKRTYLFKSSVQIFLCCLCSGFLFAAIENFLYLNIYIKEPSEIIIIWRWTACVLLHCFCCSISSFGLISIWKKSVCEFRKPELDGMNKYLVSAAIIHSLYNIIAIVTEFLGFFD